MLIFLLANLAMGKFYVILSFHDVCELLSSTSLMTEACDALFKCYPFSFYKQKPLLTILSVSISKASTKTVHLESVTRVKK